MYIGTTAHEHTQVSLKLYKEKSIRIFILAQLSMETRFSAHSICLCPSMFHCLSDSDKAFSTAS